MERSLFHFELPENLIAQRPLEGRRDSRLLVLDRFSGAYRDGAFTDLEQLLRPGDVLVLNDTRVVKARLRGRKESGGAVEVMIDRIEGDVALAYLRASKTPKAGSTIRLQNGIELQVAGRLGELFQLESAVSWPELLKQQGQVPLPPYIKRKPDSSDLERYQTVYSREPGAVAAPTAGLHFDDSMLNELRAKGVALTFVTLHVGSGTFGPVRTHNIEDHQLHREWFRVSPEVCEAIDEARGSGGRVFAVGTTSVRALETAGQTGELRPYEGDTQLFIYPGFEFKVIDGLVTNFHVPESSLLMLVSAFAGVEPTLAAYRHAVEAGYRFFSYGDAMLIAGDVS